jgi:hypothetical protein
VSASAAIRPTACADAPADFWNAIRPDSDVTLKLADWATVAQRVESHFDPFAPGKLSVNNGGGGADVVAVATVEYAELPAAFVAFTR